MTQALMVDALMVDCFQYFLHSRISITYKEEAFQIGYQDQAHLVWLLHMVFHQTMTNWFPSFLLYTKIENCIKILNNFVLSAYLSINNRSEREMTSPTLYGSRNPPSSTRCTKHQVKVSNNIMQHLIHSKTVSLIVNST